MALAYVCLCRTDRAVLAVNGFAADGNMFVKNVKQRLEVRQPHIGGDPSANRELSLQWYRHAHAKDMPLRAIARLIQTMLYARRFFPYYVNNILGGIEEDGAYQVLARGPASFLPAADPNKISSHLALIRHRCGIQLRSCGLVRARGMSRSGCRELAGTAVFG